MSSNNSQNMPKQTDAHKLIGKPLGENGSKALSGHTDAGLQAKAVKTLMEQAPAVTDRKLRDLVAHTRVRLTNYAKGSGLRATSPSATDLESLKTAFCLALTKTPPDLAKLAWMEMMHRGLSYRNDGKDLAKGKKDAFQRMLQQYPPDAALTACRALRPGGWFPSVDDVQLEIEEIIAWRREAYAALEGCEIFTDEQMFSMKSRHLSHQLAEVLSTFPIYDIGKPSRLKYFEAQTTKLRLALDAFTSHDGETTDFIDCRLISQAKGFLSDGYMPNPHRIETPKERQDRMAGERDEMEGKKAAMIEELKK